MLMNNKISKVPDPELYQKIIDNYRENVSVKQTSINCSVSEVTVRRVLITEGLWSSNTSRKIAELYTQGKSVSEIASALSVKEKAVQAYLPYSRGMYGTSQSGNARSSKNYRDRIAQAQKAVSSLTGELDESQIISEPAHDFLKFEETENNGLNMNGSEKFAETDSKQKPSGEGKSSFKGNGIIYKLHLQLTASFLNDCDKNLGLNAKERRQLFKLAKAEKGISRDILVPGNMTLHALSYAIMKSFGWQNSHLHNFALSKEDFDQVTGNGNVGQYFGLCGILFRFVDNVADAYWDDDYEENISFRSWIRKKYSAPFKNGSVGDSWIANRWDIFKFDERFPEYDQDSTFEEMMDSVILDQDPNYLIERLTVSEVLLQKSAHRPTLKIWKNDLTEKEIFLDDYLEDIDVDYGKMTEASDELMKWRDSLDNIDKEKWMFPDTYKEEIEEQTGYPYEEVLYTNQHEVKYWERKCKNMINDWNISPEPYFHELYYLYDYGDDWTVKITVEESYCREENDSDDSGKIYYTDSDAKLVGGELYDKLLSVDTKGRPVCIAADGLDLVDDCGGIYGYLDMLRTIHGRNKREANETMTWARSLWGWTGKKTPPEKIL